MYAKFLLILFKRFPNYVRFGSSALKRVVALNYLNTITRNVNTNSSCTSIQFRLVSRHICKFMHVFLS